MRQPKVVCFGEVLWDILPSGAVPGGAPMNVAYHLHKLGKEPLLITRIGNDDHGAGLKRIFEDFGVRTDEFQVDASHRTGVVYAHPNEHNEVVYDIVKPVAWDFIDWNESYADLVANANYFVFGSLASRNSHSKKTLMKLIDAAATRVLDINLRSPHYDRRIVEELLDLTDILKLNIVELELITGWFSQHTSTADRLQSLAHKFKLSTAVVTLGAEGAMLLMDGMIYEHPGYKVQVADTVGSGDAFLAGLLSKLMDRESPEGALEFANGLGAYVATRTGACPDYSMQDVSAFLSTRQLQK